MMKWIKTWSPRLLTALASAALLLLLARATWMFLDYNRILIGFPFNVDYGEGPILDQVMRLSRFENIYPTDISQSPFTIGNYPPLYHLVQLPFAWIFGPAFWYGRVINLISLLAAAYFIGASLYAITKDTLSSLVGGSFLLAMPYILHWSGFVRIDSLALAVSWAGLYTVVRFPNRRKTMIVTALCLTGAIFTRQTYGLAAPFAAFIWLLSQKPRWRAFELAGWTAAFSVILFLLINLLSGGGFYFNVITANVNPFFWETVKNYWNGIWDHMGYLVVTSLAFLVLAVWFKQKTWWLGAPYLLAATASAITIGKDGSNVNYLFELSAALAFCAGAFLAWPGNSWQGRKWVGRLWWLKLAPILLLAIQVNAIYPWAREDYYNWPTNRALHERESIAKMAELIAASDKPVLADEFMGLIPLAGKNLVFQPFEYKQLVAGEIWDQSPFIDAIFEKQYGLILLYDPPSWDSRGARWTQQQLDAIRGNYRQIDRLAETIILAPADDVQ
jgi:hypothetical protein